jgi:hypothetical protein
MRHAVRFLFAAVLVLAASCGGEVPGPGPGPVHCTPDEQQGCNCPDGTMSVMQCKSDGTWGPCQCSGQ